jgi:site-specific DNA-cytosine methylase
MSGLVPAGGRLRLGSVCTGYGGLDIAVHAVLEVDLCWYAETDRHAATVLAHQWPGVPNLGDIRAVDWDNCKRRSRVDRRDGRSVCGR